MAEIKQIERIVRILQRLATSHEVTVRQLYDYFGRSVPKRTLQRDLIELSCADIPLATRPGRGKELIWYMDGNFLKFVPMTVGSRELMASYFLERLATVAKGTKLEADTHSLLEKAKQFLSPDVFRMSETIAAGQEMFGTTYLGHVDYSAHSETIDTLISATVERQRCRFVYKSAWKDKPSEFDADPYLLLYHKGALYAVVYIPSHTNYLFLPIQRIRLLKPTGEQFARRRDFSLEKVCRGRFGIFGYDDLAPERVSLRFSSDIADVVAERIWHPSQKLIRHADGSLTLELHTVISDELRSWIASWMDYVRIEHPVTLQLRRTPHVRTSRRQKALA